MAREGPLVVPGAPPCTVFSSMQNINQKHHDALEWQNRCAEGQTLLQFSVEAYWDQISRGKFFLHEHPATPPYRIFRLSTSWQKKPTKWMTNSPALASITSISGTRCTGGHEHSRLEGAKENSSGIKVSNSFSTRNCQHHKKKVKTRLIDANHARDSAHFMDSGDIASNRR